MYEKEVRVRDEDIVIVTVMGAYNTGEEEMTFEEFRCRMVIDASRHNYGVFRQWSVDGVDYYDVGPIVYKVRLAAQDVSASE